MARGNGGIIGRKNLTTFGGNNEAKFTSNGTWSPCGPSSGTKFIDIVIVAGGGGGGGSIGAPKNGGSGGHWPSAPVIVNSACCARAAALWLVPAAIQCQF